MWDRLSLVTGPASPPVTLAEAKAHLIVDHSDDDTLITALVDAAAAMIDGPAGIGYAMQPQTWKLTLDGFPSGQAISWPDAVKIPMRPVVSVDEIRYVDADGNEQTFDLFDTVISSGGALVVPNYGTAWPSTRNQPGAVEMEFTAGAGVPPMLRAAVLLIVGHLYKNREATTDAAQFELPLGVASLLDRYRLAMVAA